MSNTALETSAYNSWIVTFIDGNGESKEPLSFGVEDGIAWGVTYGPMGNLNGYAWIPREGHSWSTVYDYDDERLNDIEIHGGVTFCENGWIGFDTLHLWDIWNPDYLKSLGVPVQFPNYSYLRERWIARSVGSDSRTVWTLELVAEEAKKLARQITANR